MRKVGGWRAVSEFCITLSGTITTCRARTLISHLRTAVQKCSMCYFDTSSSTILNQPSEVMGYIPFKRSETKGIAQPSRS